MQTPEQIHKASLDSPCMALMNPDPLPSSFRTSDPISSTQIVELLQRLDLAPYQQRGKGLLGLLDSKRRSSAASRVEKPKPDQ